MLIVHTSALERNRFERKRFAPIPRRTLGDSTAGMASQGCRAPPSAASAMPAPAALPPDQIPSLRSPRAILKRDDPHPRLLYHRRFRCHMTALFVMPQRRIRFRRWTENSRMSLQTDIGAAADRGCAYAVRFSAAFPSVTPRWGPHPPAPSWCSPGCRQCTDRRPDSPGRQSACS